MKLTTGILLLAMTAGTASAQNPNILQNTKDKLNAAQQPRVDQENGALNGGQSQTAKPAPAGKPAPSVKPVAQTSTATKGAVQVKPVMAKPATAIVKPATQVITKPVAVTNGKPVAQSTKAQPAGTKGAGTAAKAEAKKPAPTKISVAAIAPQPKQGAQKVPGQKQAKAAAKKESKPVEAKPNDTKGAIKAASTDSAIAEPAKEKKTITAEGRRDPFISPVVSRNSGPNCSVGKRCLAIDQITVRGVVKAESGMIAVVVNSINKAYFLKENDPVYNGYVVKITGDSVVFKETVQDRLGKESTREVVKKITTPAV
jgi:Tfp pilus assembly protein PilP